ncbi:unnamed protein product [Boreogadus saida]
MQMASRSSVDQGHVVVLIAVGPEQGWGYEGMGRWDLKGVSQDRGRRVLIGSRVNHNSDSGEERSLRSPQDRNECFHKQHRGADKRPESVGHAMSAPSVLFLVLSSICGFGRRCNRTVNISPGTG